MANVLRSASRVQEVRQSSVSEPKGQHTYPRVTIRLVGEVGEALEDLQKITHASTPSEVVRKAILIYHTLVKQKLIGNEAYIEIEDDGGKRRVPVFL